MFHGLRALPKIVSPKLEISGLSSSAGSPLPRKVVSFEIWAERKVLRWHLPSSLADLASINKGLGIVSLLILDSNHVQMQGLQGNPLLIHSR